MDRVHVFISVGRFRSLEELRAFIGETYTEDGEGVPSGFMREVGLVGYEPGCIEAVWEGRVRPVRELLAGASYAGQWLSKVDAGHVGDAAVCVFAPNRVVHPERSSLEYVGGFDYAVPSQYK